MQTEPFDQAARAYVEAHFWTLPELAEAVTDVAIARRAAEAFGQTFARALTDFAPARIAFAHCFDSQGRVDPARAATAADSEWRSWLGGGYAVCLRAFTGETCVKKESLGAQLKRHVADPEAWPMSADEALDACAGLAQLRLPFAPWERPTGTPGRTIDVLLAQHALGCERPYR